MTTRPAVRTVRHDIAKKPFITIWEVTRACGLVCAHCRADAQHHAHPNQLTTEQGKALIDQLAAYDKPKPLLVLTGGDPFERADLEELTDYATRQGLNVSLSPSVTPLLTPERVQRLHDLGGKAMSMSLDGATAATHDAFRGFSGTFERTVDMAAHILDAGFRLQINSTLTRSNIHEAPELLKTVIEMGAKMWYVFFLVPTGRGAALNSLSPLEREDVLHWLADIADRIAIKTTEAPQYRRVVLQRRQPGFTYDGGELYRYLTEETTRLLGAHPAKPRPPRPPMAVNSGSGFAFIDHVGDVYPNGFLPMHCGNVKVEDFKDIYTHSPAFKALRDPDHWHGKCSVCEFHSVCGGSRSTAFAVTGDIRASDPTCAYLPAEWVARGEVGVEEGDTLTPEESFAEMRQRHGRTVPLELRPI
ncbi:TIGR04053 family radical SAM/SPASM domain-containing protein [Corynebacterium uterequi]|uniref:Radical SAM protein n=1 Tax=Corynebacterium uterequi TaxID=1072256 RepID=A0A0G3HFB1_9CORY|nr:TIGR04053 family radical SAM/SPASM domain-containing protein [Corynebacterium uterequi]AKK12004.1 radical SAM protein [Corynebacterium uterequi]